VIVNYLWLGLLLLTKRDLPELDGLVSRSCDQHLLIAIVRCPDLFAEDACNVVFVRRELLHCRPLVEAEQVYLIVHSSQSIRALS